MKDRIIPLTLVLLAGTALVLNSQGKLVGVGQAIFAPTPEGFNAPTQESAGTFALAFFVFLLIIAFLDEKNTMYLTLLLVLGALAWNQKTSKTPLLSTLFSPVKSGSFPGASIGLPPGTTVTPIPQGGG